MRNEEERQGREIERRVSTHKFKYNYNNHDNNNKNSTKFFRNSSQSSRLYGGGDDDDYCHQYS